jgi:hypothetical protein
MGLARPTARRTTSRYLAWRSAHRPDRCVVSGLSGLERLRGATQFFVGLVPG